MDQYRIEPSDSLFRVEAFAIGLLAFAAHSPTFVVRDYQGEVCVNGLPGPSLTLSWSANAASISLADRIKESDRYEIEHRMRTEVLETAMYPIIAFESAEVVAQSVSEGPTTWT
jgi:hypothetical protein